MPEENSEERDYGSTSVYAELEQRERGEISQSAVSAPKAELRRIVLVAAATAATLGYDVGIMAAAIQPLESEMKLSGVQKELAMGSLNFVAALGALLGGAIANKRGRKLTVSVCCWLFVVGTICMAFAPVYGVLLLGRMITGMGVGVSFVVAPVYLAEVAPAEQRGQVNTVFDVAINGGILLGYVIGFLVQLLPIASTLKWRLMLGMGLLLPIAVLFNLRKLPESPRWLVMANMPDAASSVLQGLGQTPRQVMRTVSSIEDELKSEDNQIVSLWRWSRGMRLAVALGFWQQITGTEAVLYYSADFLAKAGLESSTQRLLGNIFVGLCKLTPELIAMRVVDSVGRRPLMLGSAVSLMLTTALLALGFWRAWHPMVIVVLLCAVMASFSLGLGPFTFLVASESLGLTERATGMTLCAAANRCTSGTVALTAVSLYEALGNAGLFALYAGIGLISLPFYFTSVPETTGQTLEELAARNRGHTHVHHRQPDEEHQQAECSTSGQMA
jgi:sugar porter (SP) family MFS transporter